MQKLLSIELGPSLAHYYNYILTESTVFREICKILGIQKSRTTPLHPQSDGMVERGNRTLSHMIPAFISESQKVWDENIYLLMLALYINQQK